MRSRWWFIALMSALAALVFYLPFLYLKTFEFESVFYLVGLIAITFVVGIVVIARRISMKQWTNWRLYPAILVFWMVTVLMFWRTEDLRPWARWIAASGKYRDLVLQQKADSQSGLRHAEWDGWGWAGMDTSVQLVYDPTDSLAYELRKNPEGRFADIAVKTAKMQRLSKGWYSLTLYTNESWDQDD